MLKCIEVIVSWFTHTTLGRSTKLDGVAVSGFLRLSNLIRKDLTKRVGGGHHLPAKASDRRPPHPPRESRTLRRNRVVTRLLKSKLELGKVITVTRRAASFLSRSRGRQHKAGETFPMSSSLGRDLETTTPRAAADLRRSRFTRRPARAHPCRCPVGIADDADGADARATFPFGHWASARDASSAAHFEPGVSKWRA